MALFGEGIPLALPFSKNLLLRKIFLELYFRKDFAFLFCVECLEKDFRLCYNIDMEKMFWTKNGYSIRLAKETDAENYYSENFNPLDKEVAYLTGSKEKFAKQEVISFFLYSIKERNRYLFLIISPDNRIIGESVIDTIDRKTRSANFRICIFHTDEQGKGIGSWAVEVTRDFAFETLKLHRLSLDVYSFNKRAEKCYRKAGFKQEGVLRDAVMNGNQYADDILMSILENEWSELKNKNSIRVTP